jgi:chromosome segregation ATPase
MAGAVNVQPDKLDIFNAELSRTPVLLENVFTANREMISVTNARIDMTLDTLERKRAKADADLARAKAELNAARSANALSRDKLDLRGYEDRVKEAGEHLNEITGAYRTMGIIKNEYRDKIDRYKQEAERYLEDYDSLLGKGRVILEKYTELVRRSTGVIPES